MRSSDDEIVARGSWRREVLAASQDTEDASVLQEAGGEDGPAGRQKKVGALQNMMFKQRDDAVLAFRSNRIVI